MVEKRNEGLSLIDLLIVVAIIGIIASIAIPNLLTPGWGGTEGSAQFSLCTINSAEAAYRSTAGAGSYGTLAKLSARDVQRLSAEVMK